MSDQTTRPADRDNRAERLEALARLIPPYGAGIELGVHKGHFSDTLLAGLRPSVLHLVDPWYLLGEEWPWARGNRSTLTALCRIIERFGPHLVSGRAVLHIGFSQQVLPGLEPAGLDWAYLDSSHRYEETREELPLLARAVRPGGVIAGDDWHPDPAHQHHGVYRAVQEFVAATPYRLCYADAADKQWAIRL